MNQKQLGSSLLASVSRSFYLTLRALPAGLREPISVAYLLARATDTVSDAAQISAAIRLEHLRGLGAKIADFANGENCENGEALREDPDDFFPKLQREIVPGNAAEKILIAELPRCFDWFAAMSREDRKEIGDVLAEIVRGQELDLQRFANRDRVAALQSAAELDEYTFLVAGCVGKFWTRLCFQHLKNYARLDAATMESLGVNFGKGLQLVNVLRDLPEDLKNGRCYLPAEELRARGVEPEDFFAHDFANDEAAKMAQPVFDDWLELANRHLDDGRRYIEAVRPWRLRYAGILPWALGVKTLALLKVRSPLANAQRIKVPRREVYWLMLRALPFAFWNCGL